MRALARRIYDPMYRRWFRTEWEGLEKIPAEGGALLVALDEWVVSGKVPPASRVPTLAEGTLVEADKTGFPAVPGAAVVDGFVYWAAVVANQTDVYRSSTNLATGAAEVFATVDGEVSELAASSAGIFVVVPGGSAGGSAKGAVLRLPLAGGTGATLLPSEKNPRDLQLLADGSFALYTDEGPVRWETARTLLPARSYSVAAFAATTTQLFCLGTDGALRITTE